MAKFAALRVLIGSGVTAVGAGVYAVSEYVDGKRRDYHKKINDVLDSFSNIPTKGPTEGTAVALPALSNKKDAVTTMDYDQQSMFGFKVVNAYSEGKPHAFSTLTKRLLDVKSVLSTAVDSSFSLPSLVVIGSQSSGKSSLLEHLIGHKFLPKGQNMVTRRPIEITLVNSPLLQKEYAELPREGVKTDDFSSLARTLSDLNLSVSEEECVSNDPIVLRIYSPTLPDLQLVDLPGYIAVNSSNQPKELKQKIVQLCREYLKDQNVILAVSAADVDLANSEALNEARNADPLGKRTIGVLTKMDLVPVEKGQQLLNNDQYHLKLGYYGVVCTDSSNAEQKLFSRYAQKYQKNVSTGNLLTKLVGVLESSMVKSLNFVVDKVRKELEETKYKFKVRFNDRHISAESYASDVLDQLKEKLRDVSKEFNRNRLREEVLEFLDTRMIQALKQVYYNDDTPLKVTMKWTEEELAEYHGRLERSRAMLTMAGIGRLTTEKLVGEVEGAIEKVLVQQPFSFHASTMDKVRSITTELLRSKVYQTSESVENAIKPYKYDVDFNDVEWRNSLTRCLKVLQKEKDEKTKELNVLKNEVGARKLRNAMQYLSNRQKSSEAVMEEEKIPFSPKVMELASEALEVQKTIDVLSQRISFLTPTWFSHPCYHFSMEHTAENACVLKCPEIYLSLITQHLAQTCVAFIWIDLLNEVFYELPRHIDTVYFNSRKDAQAFASENDGVKEQLETEEKLSKLSYAMDKLGVIQNDILRGEQ
ncbi:hypothetical protein MP638_001966 [Amoeboaphelidium occidentale]|nr:hypothetical protein MP638_001966 [Amoeboaphelidium occidentale]